MLNLKSIKVTNGENINNLPIQVSTKGIWGGAGLVYETGGWHLIQSGKFAYII